MFPTPGQIEQLQSSLQSNLQLFLPELVLCFGIVLLLLCRLVKAFDRTHLGTVAAAIVGVALLTAGYLFLEGDLAPVEFFAGMLASDPFSGFVRILLLAA